MHVYGLKNCDTCRKAKKWLTDQGIAFDFSDLRDTPLPPETLKNWLDKVGIDTLINRRGTTWRTLSEDQKIMADGAQAIDLITSYPALLKRPIFCVHDHLIIGFSDKEKAKLLS